MTDLSVREFGLLVQGPCSAATTDVCGIASDAAWDFLENLAYSGDANHRFIEVARFEGRKALRVMNFVGVISTPDGTRIEILPKTSQGRQDLPGTREVLWKMLGVVENLKLLETTEARLRLRTAPLVEALVAVFLDHVASLARRGIRREYKRVEDEERFLRGRLRVMQQMRAPPGRQHRFHLEYDVLSENRAENRLIHSALAKVARSSRSANNQRLARELRHGFHAVPLSSAYPVDFQAWRTGRDMAHYQPLLPWLRLILDEQAPFSLKDEHAGISFLFPMETLFEKYVKRVLASHFAPRQVDVHAQVGTRFLSDLPRAFQLRPDMVLARGQQWLAIVDTKWKLIDQRATYGNGKDDPKAGIAQADMYQLFAYGHKYLGGQGRLVLVYPRWSGFDAPLPSFHLGGQLILDVVPFDLVTDQCVLLDACPGLAPVAG